MGSNTTQQSLLACLLPLVGLGCYSDVARAQCEIAPVSVTALTDGFSSRGLPEISRDGGMLVQGSGDSSSIALNAGAAHVFRLEADIWTLQETLIPDDLETQDRFGDAVDIDGDTIIVGAPYQDARGTNSGSAYIYRNDGTGWRLLQKLVPTGVSTGNLFGFSVAVEDQTILISALGDNTNGNFSGAVYAYTANGPDRTAWTLEETIRPDDNSVSDLFGTSVDIDAGRGVVGASQNAREGQNALVPGSVYVYRRDADRWTQTQNIFPQNVHAAGFGFSVDLNGTDLIVGARDSTSPDGFIGQAGAAFVYHFDGESWGAESLLSAPNPVSFDLFGQYVTIDGNVAVVDSPEIHRFPNPPGQGHIYVFERDAETWTLRSQYNGGVPGSVAYFYYGVAPQLIGNDLVLGAPFQDLNTGDLATDLVVLDLGCVGNTCPADLDGDGDADADDFFAYLDAFAIGDADVCDIDGDGDCDADDFFGYLDQFALGC